MVYFFGVNQRLSASNPKAQRWVRSFPEFQARVGQIIPGMLSSGVGQTISGKPGSSHFRNPWVKSFPEPFPEVGQMLSGIFSNIAKIFLSNPALSKLRIDA